MTKPVIVAMISVVHSFIFIKQKLKKFVKCRLKTSKLYSKTSLARTSGDRPRTSVLTEVRVIGKLKKV